MAFRSFESPNVFIIFSPVIPFLVWRKEYPFCSHEQSPSVFRQTPRKVRLEGEHVQAESVQDGAGEVEPHPKGPGLHEQPPRGHSAGEG